VTNGLHSAYRRPLEVVPSLRPPLSLNLDTSYLSGGMRFQKSEKFLSRLVCIRTWGVACVKGGVGVRWGLGWIAITLLDTFQSYKMAIREVNMSNNRYTEEFILKVSLIHLYTRHTIQHIN